MQQIAGEIQAVVAKNAMRFHADHRITAAVVWEKPRPVQKRPVDGDLDRPRIITDDGEINGRLRAAGGRGRQVEENILRRAIQIAGRRVERRRLRVIPIRRPAALAVGIIHAVGKIQVVILPLRPIDRQVRHVAEIAVPVVRTVAKFSRVTIRHAHFPDRRAHARRRPNDTAQIVGLPTGDRD